MDSESRNEVRMMPSFRLITPPSGLHHLSLAVKSVSGADDDAHSVDGRRAGHLGVRGQRLAAVDQDIGPLLDRFWS